MLSQLPSSPGVYWFLDEKQNVLYVGKAKNLKRRVSQYTQLKRLPAKIKRMVHLAHQVKFEELESEFEALLIEAELIRLHQPEYNTMLKDDKSPIYVQLTDEKFPRVLTVRKRDLDHNQVSGTILGPFSSAYQLKEVLRIVRPIFPWCNQRGDSDQTNKACFYYHLEQCPGACLGQISPEDYQQTIKQLTLFLRGKKKDVIKNLESQLKQAANNEKFEKAAIYRDRLQLIKNITQRHYQLKPDLILPNLTEHRREQALLHLRRILSTYMHLPKSYPLHRIEGYDVSNTSGKNASVSMVTFIDGEPETSEYKLFNIRTLDTPNDYHMLKEAVTRRQNNPSWGQPDLLVIDGGKGQLRAALQNWTWETPIVSIAKNPDRLILPIKISRPKNSTRMEITYKIVKLPEDHPTLNLIQHIRDESHRFSKRQHTRRRLKSMFQ